MDCNSRKSTFTGAPLRRFAAVEFPCKSNFTAASGESKARATTKKKTETPKRRPRRKQQEKLHSRRIKTETTPTPRRPPQDSPGDVRDAPPQELIRVEDMGPIEGDITGPARSAVRRRDDGDDNDDKKKRKAKLKTPHGTHSAHRKDSSFVLKPAGRGSDRTTRHP